MSGFISGSPIFYDTIKEELEFDGITNEADIRREMASRAWKVRNADDGEGKVHNQAILRANGMKEEFGNGVCTRILVYNASGGKLTFRSEKTISGRWSQYSIPHTIEVGEWAVCLHVKKTGAAAGSGGVVAFNIEGFDNVFVVGWDTPWSGANHGSCYTMRGKAWSETPWSTILNWAETDPDRGSDTEGSMHVEYSMDQESSPTLTVTIKHVNA